MEESRHTSSSCYFPHWKYPAVSLLPSWLFSKAAAHAKAIVVILNFESAASFGTWCCGSCKLQDAVGKAYLGSIYYAISCVTYSCYFNLLFNVVEIVGPRGVELHTQGVTDQNL